MVTIPDEVKALFSSDTVHKNFHVTFPNGETTDLNNEDVISESVKFTESLCSQQYFKFGLAEASQIEFVAVGIPNVRGAYIECGIEIDCTRLGAAWAAAHPVDASLPFLTPQTCNYDGKLYYRVPYGRFKIDTCPRNHGAMYQRQITAYSEVLHTNEQMSLIENYKLNMPLPNNTVYEANLIRLVLANVGYYDESIMSAFGYDETVAKSWTGTPTASSQTMNCYNKNGESVTLKFEYSSINRYIQKASSEMDKLYKFDLGDYDLSEYQAALDSLNEEYIIRNIIADRSIIGNYNGRPRIWADSIPKNTYVVSSKPFYYSESIPCLYPQRANNGVYSWNFVVLFTFKVTETKNNISTVLYDLDLSEGAETVKLYEWAKETTTILDDIVLKIVPTLTGTSSVNYNGSISKYKWQSYANAYSYTDIMIGFLELCGWFLKPDRSGSLDFFQMSLSPTPISVSASDWSEFWWDETPIESIGQVNVIYTVDNEEQQETFSIGSGNSVYTIENNEVLKAAEMDTATMESILQIYFAPNASVVNFTPVDLTMRGLPFLESGDYIELTAEDGETVDTYILSQTISGIQHLTAEITSTNGNLLEVIA